MTGVVSRRALVSIVSVSSNMTDVTIDDISFSDSVDVLSDIEMRVDE